MSSDCDDLIHHFEDFVTNEGQKADISVLLDIYSNASGCAGMANSVDVNETRIALVTLSDDDDYDDHTMAHEVKTHDVSKSY